MKGDNISQRLLDFAAQVLRLVSKLPSEPTAKHLAKQLIRAATASGANYEEARGAESRADFVHKIKVAAKEARESHYWLRLLVHSGFLPETEIHNIIQETYELIAILSASAKTAQSHRNDNYPQ